MPSCVEVPTRKWLKPYEKIAKRIQKACKGMGANELLLTCTIIRYQAHLPKVMAAFEELTGKTLQETLKKEVGGDYRRLLTELIVASSYSTRVGSDRMPRTRSAECFGTFIVRGPFF